MAKNPTDPILYFKISKSTYISAHFTLRIPRKEIGKDVILGLLIHLGTSLKMTLPNK